MPFSFKDKPKHLYAEDVRDYLRQLDEVFNMIEEEMKDEEDQSNNQDQPQNNRSAVELPQSQSLVANNVSMSDHPPSEQNEENKISEDDRPNNQQNNSFSDSSVNMGVSPRINRNRVDLKRNIEIASHANSSSIEV